MLTAELVDVALFASEARYGDLVTHVTLDLRRRFTRAELERAVAAAIAAFPVLGCVYQPRLVRDRWRPSARPIAELVHVVEGELDLERETIAWARRTLALTRERPLRLVSLPRGAGSRVLVTLSHLAVDGAGMAAVGSVLAAALTGSAPIAEIDPRRDLASSLAALRPWHLPALARDAARALATPLAVLRAAPRERGFPTEPGGASHWRHVRLSPDETARLKARASAEGASLNDAIIAALARVTAGRAAPGAGALPILYTMDLRRYAGRPRLVAANTSSILTVFVPRRATVSLDASLAAVARVTGAQRRGLAGPATLLVPHLLGLGLPHALARRVTRLLHPVLIGLPLERGMMLTNVGRLDTGLRALGEDLEDVRIIGPNARGVPIPSVVAHGFRGALHLELYAAPGLASAALDDFERELRDALELT
ncbi:MAG: hypothetical protein OZ921_18130 [Sorangiineae bacterium]|nr:hypothetical protein [Polyangiaceae bacterium]MEB2324438.1 hypothetical protein [Sorangiineae bacterium]